MKVSELIEYLSSDEVDKDAVIEVCATIYSIGDHDCVRTKEIDVFKHDDVVTIYVDSNLC